MIPGKNNKELVESNKSIYYASQIILNLVNEFKKGNLIIIDNKSIK